MVQNQELAIKNVQAATESKGEKHCDLCAKYSPRSSKTHHTSQCFKCNSDGSKKPRHSYSGRGSVKEKAKRYSNAIKKAENLKNKNKKMKRKLKRSKKRRSSNY